MGKVIKFVYVNCLNTSADEENRLLIVYQIPYL
jgi:hypothetical protein